MSAVRAQDTLFFPHPIEDRNKWLRPAAMMTSNSVEWFTPPVIRDAVIEALGGRVDLDPCADPGKTFPAAQHYTQDDNGLTKPWDGRVYMNPPYGRTIRRWTTKLRDELMPNGWVSEAVALLPVRPGARWWRELKPAYVCFLSGRQRFSGYPGAAPFDSAAVYFGPRPERFASAFGHLGELMSRYETEAAG